MWANSVWGFFGFAVTFMLAILGLSPQYSWLAPWFMGAAGFCGLASVTTLVWPFIGKRVKVSGPFFTMAFGAVVFLCGLAWQTWPKTSAEENSEEILSAQDRMRRKFVVEDATQDYLNRNPNADPLVFAGLKNAPADFINAYIRSIGEKWVFRPSNITPAAEGGVYVYCDIAQLPLKFRDGEPYHTINVHPLPLSARGGAGWNTFVSPKDTEVTFGLKNKLITKCEITNYAKAPIVDLTMALSVVWQNVDVDASNPNAQRSGSIYLARPWYFGIPKIDPGAENKITFYMPNISKYFVQISFPERAVGRFVDSGSLNYFPLSTNVYIPIVLNPFDG